MTSEGPFPPKAFCDLWGRRCPPAALQRRDPGAEAAAQAEQTARGSPGPLSPLKGRHQPTCSCPGGIRVPFHRGSVKRRVGSSSALQSVPVSPGEAVGQRHHGLCLAGATITARGGRGAAELVRSTHAWLSACCLFFLVNQQESPALPLCQQSIPPWVVRGERRDLHLGFPLVAPRGPRVQGMRSHVQVSPQAGLAVWDWPHNAASPCGTE